VGYFRIEQVFANVIQIAKKPRKQFRLQYGCGQKLMWPLLY